MSYRNDLEFRNGRIRPRTDANAQKELPEFRVPEKVHPGFIESVMNDAKLEDDTTLKATRDVLATWRASFEGLNKVRSTQDPAVTQAAHLQSLAKHTDAALARVSQQYDRANAGLRIRREALEVEATERLGLTSRGQSAESEIRSALRSMTDEQRQKAIGDAIQRGDGEVIHAIRNASPLVSGVSAENQGTIIRRAMLAHAPDVLTKQEAIETAQTRLGDAYIAALECSDDLKASSVAAEYRQGSEKAAQARAAFEAQQ
ncbi:hypothetical protein [Celeribacter sp.]|uniref:hypothetical protein n=1 Tax=Celeribacter sp. TaxID=1890673 RepID=UPI003A8E5C26